MADEETLRRISSALRGSKITHEPVRFLMPTNTPEAAARYLHQVTLVPHVSQRRCDMLIRLELYRFEADKADSAYVKGLDANFASYLADGEFIYNRRGWDRVKFVGPDGYALWPDRYELRATFEERHLASADEGRKRLRKIEAVHEKGWERVLYLSWSKVLEALKTDVRVDDVTEVRDVANLYQMTLDAEGKPVLWAARLPRLLMSDRPDAEHQIKVHRDRNGYAALLSATFLENLVLMLHAGEDPDGMHVVEDGLSFARGFYLRRDDGDSSQSEEQTSETASGDDGENE